MPEIKWLGHACFRVRGRDAVVLMDPVGPESGYDIGEQEADIVTVSHDDPGHNALGRIKPGFHAITGPGEYEISEVYIQGFHTSHGAQGDEPAGKNTVYVVEIEDLTICHLGDLGQVLDEEQAADLGSIDVLLVPVGGGPTLDATKASEVIAQVEPSLVIPMQYRTALGDQGRDPLERFIKEMGVSEAEPRDRISLKKSDLGETMQVVVLQP